VNSDRWSDRFQDCDWRGRARRVQLGGPRSSCSRIRRRTSSPRHSAPGNGDHQACYGGIEAGGTKFVCAVGSGPGEIVAERVISTSSPQETLAEAEDFLEGQARQHALRALGVACFGPLDLDQGSPTFGWITTTPKPGWASTDILGRFEKALGLPVAIDTDVNAAALAEAKWGAARGRDPAVYVTIGTGIGVGVIANGRPLHGLIHPEGGHMLIPHDRAKDPFAGACPYHGDCLEGLASGPAITKRWGISGEQLPDHHPAWDLEAWYVALAVMNLVCVLSPQRIVLGGGLMRNPSLIGGIRSRVKELLNGYVQSVFVSERIQEYIVLPALEGRSGVLGAIALAQASSVS
jgi:fructokinase